MRRCLKKKKMDDPTDITVDVPTRKKKNLSHSALSWHLGVPHLPRGGGARSWAEWWRGKVVASAAMATAAATLSMFHVSQCSHVCILFTLDLRLFIANFWSLAISWSFDPFFLIYWPTGLGMKSSYADTWT